MACETHPVSPSPADSSGCRHQTAEHPKDANGEEESVRKKNGGVGVGVMKQQQ